MLTNRAQRRAQALALQIHHAGFFVQCHCGDPGCFQRVTPRDRAQRIIDGQRKTLRLDQATIDAALRMVQLI
jgi:hypothetical protein